MIGMSASTGKPLSGAAHLAQSIGDILSTPIGSRVMQRDYGSLLPDLLDQPVNGALPMLLRAATATAIARWEHRIAVSRVRFAGDPAHGALTILIDGQRLDSGARNALETLSIPIRTASPAANA